MSKKGTNFSAHLQFNADRRGLEFRFQDGWKQEQKHPIEMPKTFRKRELSHEQRSSLQEGKTVYIGGLTDKNGKVYSGYITLNKEDGKLGFMFPQDYKKAVEEGKVIPDNKHKTQVSVNTEGKTNEATKHIQEPLKQGQTQPTEKQMEKQQKFEKPQKKGISM
jgi:hypothetical protein